MKFFSSELAHSYESYSFGYCNYCVRERGDRLSNIYERGFLPYSGKIGIKDTFYMARSARVDIRKMELSSENRRVLGKFAETFTRTSTPLSEFNYHDEQFLNFCLEYFAKRHGPDVMPRERLLTILDMGFVSHIVTYAKDERAVAAVFEVSDERMTHFWSSFYDLSLVQQSLGMWLMLDSLLEAQKKHREHFYAGTVYGEKALYKTNLPSLEWWNGEQWIADTAALKSRAREDNQRVVPLKDEWKKSTD